MQMMGFIGLASFPCESAEVPSFFNVFCGRLSLERDIFNFLVFLENKKSLKSFNVIFENSSPKGSSRQNMEKSTF